MAALGAAGGMAAAGVALVWADDKPQPETVADASASSTAPSSTSTTATTWPPRAVSVLSPDGFVPIDTADQAPALALEELHAADGSVDHTWWDEATGSYHLIDRDIDGRVLYEAAATVTPNADGADTWAEVQVDHVQRLSTELAPTALASEPERGPADTLRRRIDTGELRPDGTEVVDGQELLRLVDATHDGEPIGCEDVPAGPERASCFACTEGSPPPGPPVVPFLADPVSLRPLRETHAAGTPAGFTTVYRYFVRDEQSPGVLTLDVPEGFRHVPSIPPRGPLSYDRTPDYYCD